MGRADGVTLYMVVFKVLGNVGKDNVAPRRFQEMVNVIPTQPGQQLGLPVRLYPLLLSHSQLPPSPLPAPVVMMTSFQTSLSGGSVDLISTGF